MTIESIEWTTLGRQVAYRLHPGEACEIDAPGIGIDHCTEGADDWANARPGVWILASEGDSVVFQPGEIMLTGNLARKTDADWWRAFIAERLKREAPVPGDTKERQIILFRVVRDLFGNSPSPEEAAAFYADKSADALENLASRLSQRSWISAVSGPIHARETKFRIVAADPDAATKPRVVTREGRYNLSDDMRVVVMQRMVGKRIVNEAQLVWYPQDTDSQSLSVSLPDGDATWSAAWLPDSAVLWIQQQGLLRRVDFTNPAEITVVNVDSGDTASVPTEIQRALDEAMRAADNRE